MIDVLKAKRNKGRSLTFFINNDIVYNCKREIIIAGQKTISFSVSEINRGLIVFFRN